ncbi:MAG TPA: hypothetical protein VGQ76_26835, partial [Thermoanaerobaculia bacterium]|nr:hypothetical protein [Thermoanaerobaculia bacterium]
QPQEPRRTFRSFVQLPTPAPVQKRFVPPDRNVEQNEPRFYVCPKDGASLRVPSAKANAKFLCPVDGTEMTEGVGPSKKFFLLEDE